MNQIPHTKKEKQMPHSSRAGTCTRSKKQNAENARSRSRCEPIKHAKEGAQRPQPQSSSERV